ncbi:peptidogalycan biosysnthesis protein, partial [Pseudomonas sp. FW300-N1A5]|uniref:peptidogalycan biosysnthesis protein n=1 Tax=Pseudomonas sp. FW300-N1A5 TaxID=2070664 RepID=UPI000CC7EC78
TAIRKQDWDFFYECYVHTHQQYQSPQALNREFFECIEKELSQNILLILGDRMGVPICGALNFMNDEAIFGRSWGALEAHDSLH